MTAPGPTLYRAEWILPVSGPPLHDGELLVDGEGRIAAVAPRGALDLPADITVDDLGSAILLPGLVNVHLHPELAMFRGALEDLRFNDWILRLVGTKRRSLDEGDARAAADWTMVEAIAAGMTTLAATEASGAAAGAMRGAGVRGVVYQEVFGPDPAAAEGALRQLRDDLERLGAPGDARVRIGISPHAPYTVSDALYRGAAALAADEALPMAMHIAESADERALVTRGEGAFAPGLRSRGIETRARAASPIQLLAELGLLEQQPLLIHCVDVDEEDVERIARAGAAVAHCPIANARLGHGLAPIDRLGEAGVTVGLGTDSVGSNNRLDLLEEARVSSLLRRAANRAPAIASAESLLRLCTIDGARALGLDERVGTLEVGKDADLCAISLAAPHLRPVHDPLATLFHAARATDVIRTVVAGRVLYADGEHRTIDVPAARQGVEVAAAKMRKGG